MVLELSEIGFGGASLGNLYRAISNSDAEAAVSAAYGAGFRLFDTAPYYGFGLSERRLGDVLRNVPRDSFSVSTKVGRLLVPDNSEDLSGIRHAYKSPLRHGFVSPMPFKPVYDYSYDGFMRSHEASLQRLGLGRVDILLVHDIGEVTHGADNERYFKELENSGYKALDELRSNGDIKAIGLGVNEWQACLDVMKIGQWDCFLLAGRYTLLEQTALECFFPQCEQHGAKIILGGVYNSGILATGTRHAGTIHYNYEEASRDIINHVREIENLCSRFNIDLPAAALQFALAHPVVASVVPGLDSPERVDQTVKLANQQIPGEFWATLRDRKLIRGDAPTPLSHVKE